jgi:DnaJ-domain-containing protein 1
MRRAFPGGLARLPRLSGPADAPVEYPIDDMPLRRDPEERIPAKDRGFEAYYSTESLFQAPESDPIEEEGPYAVLGLRRTASWEEVAKAHRKLVAQLHPDRYVGEDDVIRSAAERRVRDVNEAYATIRRQRAVQRA